MTLALLLRLGRVSNLPTVCTNVLAGLVLAGVAPTVPLVLALWAAASLLYVAGMVLNDVYDADIDARERPERPIPAGQIARAEASRWGHGLLAAGVAIAGLAGVVLAGSTRPLHAATITAAFVVIYDRHHKGNPYAPAIMGLCRMGVYVTAASFAAAGLGDAWIGGVLLAAYVLGLTYVAGFENRSAVGRAWPLASLFAPVAWSAWHAGASPLTWSILVALALWIVRAIRLARIGRPDTTRSAVVSLIAGIALLDAAAISARGHHGLALVAVAGFGLTLALQRRVAGT